MSNLTATSVGVPNSLSVGTPSPSFRSSLQPGNNDSTLRTTGLPTINSSTAGLPANNMNHHTNGSAASVLKSHCLGSTKGRDHPNVDPDTFKILQEFFRPFNHKFFRMIGKRLNWENKIY